jgi:thiamine biosynthesis lipoprotein
MAAATRRIEMAAAEGYWVGRFRAMASPCEVLVETRSAAEARDLTGKVASCAWRIDDKFSRYRTDNIIALINGSDGTPVTVDEETADLLDFAATLQRLSEGRFDITSGVLRRAWTFDRGASVPSQAEIDAILPFVGWDKARWQRPVLTLLRGMQIDFGGIGKEYAVDQAVGIAGHAVEASVLVNFGGDLAITRPRRDGRPWRVGIEDTQASPRSAAGLIDLRRGALATSGDTHRFALKDGRRYTHILDPRTGWPVEGAPRSVTVAAPTCVQAGTLTTLAILRGAEAARFLQAEGVRHWMQWQ